MKTKPSKNLLLKERSLLLFKLSKFSFVLRGSLRCHGNICGNPTCRCKDKENPKPHGPYNYLSHRYQDKTQTIFLNDSKLKLAKKGIQEYKKMLKTFYRLSEINFRLLRYYHKEMTIL